MATHRIPKDRKDHILKRGKEDGISVSQAILSGFTITHARQAERDIIFSWLAIVSEQPRTVAEATKADSLGTGEFPVDAQGFPLSSSDIWNKCIRNQAPLDITGKPFSCRRYHDEDLWTHPDLLVEFLWDPAAMTKRMLPDGYAMVAVREEHIVKEGAPGQDVEASASEQQAGGTETGSTMVSGTGSVVEESGEDTADTGTGSAVESGSSLEPSLSGSGSEFLGSGTGSAVEGDEGIVGGESGSMVNDGGNVGEVDARETVGGSQDSEEGTLRAESTIQSGSLVQQESSESAGDSLERGIS